jgi:hypothetical protein
MVVDLVVERLHDTCSTHRLTAVFGFVMRCALVYGWGMLEIRKASLVMAISRRRRSLDRGLTSSVYEIELEKGPDGSSSASEATTRVNSDLVRKTRSLGRTFVHSPLLSVLDAADILSFSAPSSVASRIVLAGTEQRRCVYIVRRGLTIGMDRFQLGRFGFLGFLCGLGHGD